MPREAKNPITILQALGNLGIASSRELATVTKLHRNTVTRVLRDLRNDGKLHICAWEANGTHMPTCFYKLGRNPDMPKPKNITCLKPKHAVRADVAAAWLRNPV